MPDKTGRYFLLLRLSCLLIAGCLTSHAQDQKIVDSLLTELKAAEEDTNKVNLLYQLSEICAEEDILKYAGAALQLAEKTNYQKGIADAANNMGYRYQQQGNISKALEYYYKSLYIQEKIGNLKGVAASLGNIAIIYQSSGDVSKAIEYSEKSIETLEKINDKEYQGILLNNLGNIYENQGNLEKALEYYYKSLRIQEKNNNKREIAIALNNIGVIYNYQGNISNALDYFHKSLKIREEIANKQGIAGSLNNIAAIYLQQKKYKQAEELSRRSLQISQKLGFPAYIRNASERLSMIYAEQGDYKNAFKMHQLFKQMADSINNEQVRKTSIKKQMQYEFEKKEQQIKFEHEKETASLTQQSQILALENSKNKYIIYGLAGSILLIAPITILFIRHQKLKAKQQTTEMKHKLLRYQMNPHFIFNSLNAIQSFIYNNEIKESAEYLADFALLMRMILENSRQEYISLEKEINTLEHYLRLQQLRFENKFHFFVEIDPSIDKDIVAIPPMFAQPFIENALEHGIKYKDARKGKIAVRFKLNNGTIVVEVEDNGIGRKRSHELKMMEGKKHQSFATAITKERIEALNKGYRKKITFDIVDIEENGEYGTKVIFQIPYKLFEIDAQSLN